MILFGSVARGDAREDSDTDVFILLRVAGDDSTDRIIDVTVDIDMDMGECCTHIMPTVLDLDAYNYKKQFGGFFKNLDKEGVILYDDA